MVAQLQNALQFPFGVQVWHIYFRSIFMYSYFSEAPAVAQLV